MRTMGGPSGAVVLDLLVDPGDQTVAQGLGGDEQASVGLTAGVAGQPVEEVGEVRADLRVGGEQTEVLVEPGRLRVVCAAGAGRPIMCR